MKHTPLNNRIGRKSIQFLILLLITINTLQAQEISPFLFGQNMWLTNGAEGRPGYIDKLWTPIKESGVKLIRIGGAGYDRNMPDTLTLVSWVKSIKAIGAEPLLQVSKFDSPEESAGWVAFFNSNEATKIKYWSIGNEPYHMDKFPIDSIANYIKSHATAMKSVDANIKILVPDLAAYYNNVYEALLLSDKNSIAGRDDNGNWYVDGINFHNYPNSKNYSRADVIFYSVSKMRGMVIDITNDIEKANKKYERTGADALIWGITEFNITYNNPDDLSTTGIAVPSFINGQFWVDVFCMAMEYKAFTVTPWCIQESDRNSTYFGYIGGPPNFTPHATYYHTQLLSKYMSSGTYIKTRSDEPFMKLFATKDNDIVTVLMMNQDDKNSYTLDLSTINKATTGKNIKITAVETLKLNYKTEIKPNTTLLIRFNKKGEKIHEEIYDLELCTQNLPPKVIFTKK